MIGVDRYTAPDLLHAMLRARRLEEKCAELCRAGKIRGFLHFYVGEEAIATGAPLRDEVDLDSFDFLNVIIRINELLGVVVPESDHERLASIDSTVDYLVARGG